MDRSPEPGTCTVFTRHHSLSLWRGFHHVDHPGAALNRRIGAGSSSSSPVFEKKKKKKRQTTDDDDNEEFSLGRRIYRGSAFVGRKRRPTAKKGNPIFERIGFWPWKALSYQTKDSGHHER